MPTSADLRTLASFCAKHKWSNRVAVAMWGANTIDMLTTWQTTAQGQLDGLTDQVVTDDAEISTLRGQVKDTAAQVTEQAATITDLQSQITTLIAQLAAATISPLSLVMIDTHLYGFSSVDASAAFAAANSGQPMQQFKVTDFHMYPPESTT